MEKGDKITVLMPGNDVLHTTYEMPSTLSPEKQFHAYATFVEILQLSEEGITWIRGHHLCDSKEVSSMRVAKALSAPAATNKPKIDKKLAQQLFANTFGSFAAELVHKFITGEKKP